MITQSGTSSASTPGKEFIITASQVVLATNSARRGAIITALTGNTKRARYSFSTQAKTNSMPLEAGSSLTIDSSYFGPVAIAADDLATAITIYVVEW